MNSMNSMDYMDYMDYMHIIDNIINNKIELKYCFVI